MPLSAVQDALTVVVPSLTPMILPPLTVAISSSSLVHVISGFFTVVPLEVAVVLIVAVPVFLMLYSEASKARLPDPLTIILTVSFVLELSHSAVTVASPADLAVTIPSESTVATVGLSILQKINPAVAASPVSPLPSINLYLIAFVFASSS